MATAQASALSQPLGRFADLVGLAERRLDDAFGGRIARLYAWGIAASYGLLLLLGTGKPDGVLRQALGVLAWIPGGLVALGAARDQARLDDESGVTALVRQRGFDARGLELARFLAAARRVARTTGWPALVLVLVALGRSRSVEAALSGLEAALGAAVFVAALSVSLALFARAAAVISGGRGRLLLAAFVFLPHFARSLVPWMPSLPALLGDVLGVAIGGGG